MKCLQHRCSHLRQVDQDRALLVALPVVLDIIGADQIHLFSSTRGKTGVSKTSRKFLLGSPKKLPTTASARGAKGVFFCDGISRAPPAGCPTLFPVAAAMDVSAQPWKMVYVSVEVENTCDCAAAKLNKTKKPSDSWEPVCRCFLASSRKRQILALEDGIDAMVRAHPHVFFSLGKEG